jgi:DUF917 family protein
VQLTVANLPVYALGCAIASSGGGGATKTPLTMAVRAVDALGPVDVVAVDELYDQDSCHACERRAVRDTTKPHDT